MSDHATELSAAPRDGLLARAAGVAISPAATYGRIIERPRLAGALAAVVCLSVLLSTALFSTERGREMLLDQSVRYMEAFGMTVSDQLYDRIQSGLHGPALVAAAAQAVAIPAAAAALAGMVIGAFAVTARTGAAAGGGPRFAQVYAVVVYSGFIIVLQQLVTYPLFYLKQSMASPTSLAVLLPFLDEGSFLARLAGAVDLFRVWWIVSLAVGLGALYGTPARRVARTMLGVYAVVAIALAAVGAVLGGA